MADTSGTSFTPSRDSRLNPDDVAGRSFSQVKRGYAEHEVRAFLRLVADELAASANRSRELATRVQSLEERLATPAGPPSDQDLIAALGEETARVLGQARESALELRTKAEEHARALVKEAQDNARQLRASTQQAADTKAREVEDAARGRANDIVGEARTMRDRVLADLGERRQELERQVSELRAGRGRLVEVYQVVERALSQATRVMGDEPASATTAGRTAPTQPTGPAPTGSAPAPTGAEPSPTGGDAASEGAAANGATPADSDAEEGDPAVPSPAVPDTPAPPPATRSAVTPAATLAASPPVASPRAPVADPDPTPAGAVDGSDEADGAGEPRDVGAVFDRLRSEQSSSPSAAGTAEAAGAADAPEADDAPGSSGAGAGPATAATDPEVEAAAAAAEVELDVDLEPSADQLARQARADALGAVTDDLSRRAKRAVQDEQNDVLDGLRRQRGKIDTTKVLPGSDEQLARWAHVLQPAVDSSYEAGTVAAGAPVRKRGTAVPAPLLSELTAIAVTPLRSRLESSLASVDARTPADLEITIAQVLGSRYREWRTQDLDDVLGDVLAAAYARGVHDGAPAGARLRWIPEREGRCPDCDDNALEPTTKGEAFPTGQSAPPAHPGCRCLLVVEPST